jgi:hypothetical protein
MILFCISHAQRNHNLFKVYLFLHTKYIYICQYFKVFGDKFIDINKVKFDNNIIVIFSRYSCFKDNIIMITSKRN